MKTHEHTTTHNYSTSFDIIRNQNKFTLFQTFSTCFKPHFLNLVSQLSHVCWYIHQSKTCHGSATSSFRAVDGKPADGAWIKLHGQGMWRLKSKREPVYLLIYIYILILNTGTYMDSLMFFFKTASERILGMLQRYWQPTQT